MKPSKLQIPDPQKTVALWRIVIHARALVFAHIAAFLGTGFAALAIDPTPHLPRRMGIGAVTVTFIQVLWVGWPFLASLSVSRSKLPGKILAIGLFLILLIAVTVIGGVFLDASLAKNEWGWNVLQITVVEAVLLIAAARILAHVKPG
jgi:hypothetical protein